MMMLWGACAKRHCKRRQTQKTDSPTLLWLGGIRNFFALLQWGYFFSGFVRFVFKNPFPRNR